MNEYDEQVEKFLRDTGGDTVTKKQRDELWTAVGGLSTATKMPWYSYSLPAGPACPGSAERCTHPDAVCRVCYAKRGMYQFKGPKAARARRLEIVKELHNGGLWTLWTLHMSALLNHEADKALAKDPRFVPRFRWHDSGDLISVPHATAIAEVARRCPGIAFWLPTQEPQFVQQAYFLIGANWPENLCVRIGFRDIDQPVAPEEWWHKPCPGAQWSRVVTDRDRVTCMATTDVGSCKEAGCSLCWNRDIMVVKYLKH